MGMASGEVGGSEAAAPRRTASQMQRGSGELQSTPTGFWKLQSDPVGAGHGSIAAGIGALSLFRSASLATSMGCDTLRHQHKVVDNVQTQKYNQATTEWLVSVPSDSPVI